MDVDEFNSITSPVHIDVQLVIYDDDHQWVFVSQPKYKLEINNPPLDLFVPKNLFQFESNDDPRLNQPMALYYVDRKRIPKSYRVVLGKAAEWRIDDNYKYRYPAYQIALADVTFPSVLLKLDTRTLDSESVAGEPTLLCHYSHTQFNLGWMDAGPRNGPSERDRDDCQPYDGQAEAGMHR